MLVNANCKTNCDDCSIRVYRLFQPEWQHETDIWERLPYLLPLYIAVFYIKQSYGKQLSIFCSSLLLLCQHFALCFYLSIIPIIIYPAKSTHPQNWSVLKSCHLIINEASKKLNVRATLQKYFGWIRW